MERVILLQDARNQDIKAYDRVYIGNEFCQNLLPDISVLEENIEYVLSRGKRFSIVTPYVTGSGLKQAKSIFQYLAEHHPTVEIIINDFGLLNIIKKKRYEFTIILGRVKVHNIMQTKMEQRLNSESAFDFFRSFGVKRIECDYRGPQMRIDDIRMPISLYYPYVYMTTSRRCMLEFSKSVDDPEFSPVRCHKRCRQQYHTLTNRRFCDQIYVFGNTNFIKMEQTEQKIPQVDRLVYLPDNFFNTG